MTILRNFWLISPSVTINFSKMIKNQNNGKNGQETHCTKMGADRLTENTLNAKAQTFWISQKKRASLGVRSP